MGACDCIITKVFSYINIVIIPISCCCIAIFSHPHAALVFTVLFLFIIGWAWYNSRGLDKRASNYP